MMYVGIAIIVLMFAISLYTDTKGWRIKNIVTLPAALIGLILSFFYFHPLHVSLYVVLLIIIGGIGWVINLWKAGDTKLILSSAVWGMFIMGPNLLFVLFYYLAFLVFHLIIGHILGLKKYKFNLKKYMLSLTTKVNETYGKMPGTFVIMCSFFIALFITK
ncbi:hypothetical protein [Bacillus piscicola]|uniref:hypothetical protein n=1 Tax=Bacillus piscicola TaxID=1632684 RepID=UPI001F09A3E7|nr:hypothetical protein [Bacillus piscicola]